MSTLIKKIAMTAAFGAAMCVSAAVTAAPVTDVKEYANNTATEFFVINDAAKYNAPYYRWASEDWGWTHNAIAGTFSSIKLDISAFDVDYFTQTSGEIDLIWVFDGSDWLSLGNLAGASDIWAFTSFDLSSYSWAQAQVNAGLKLRMDIDALNQGWAVTLGKSTLSVDGGNKDCVPTPGVPCNPVTVSEPAALGLFGLALLGLGLRRRKSAV
ncbi:MAG: PEP-CTERM sorting domain-containing protein [Rheinheimera sp.]